jgi:hypothetical protein
MTWMIRRSARPACIKCTPGLYQVVRGVITDNQAAVDNLDVEAIEAAADKIDMPFKFGN